MLLLTVNKGTSGNKEKREFAKLNDAIEFGQRSGADYEIFDPATGRTIDWNEVNVREDDGWYYDDKEYLWKRCRPEDEPEDGIIAMDFRFDRIGQNRNLRRAGS